ncbi:hypothetical protein [Actinomadura sp. BRA 177]|uniref:hypothetical protein n=1 Tax=Actinomadura sp. BRA 177 TaxID=2745202 RepID=UPI001595CC4D|nr:hypothetical protein [Actinomadura sp. BRA 177]NVI92746.1 hypothetical protein [Actinomadura sp. BRA 177]
MPDTHGCASESNNRAASCQPLLTPRELHVSEPSEGTVLSSALRRARAELLHPHAVRARFTNHV